MSDDELTASIGALEARVTEGERQVARLQPELEAAAAEAFAGADLATVKTNAAAVREAEQALTDARDTLAGLRHEVDRRAAEGEIARAERRRKAAEEAVVAYIDAAKRMDAATPAYLAVRSELHVAREAVFRSLPEKIRGDFCPELLRADAIDNQITNALCGQTSGQLIRPRGLLGPFELTQLPGLAELVAPLQAMLGRLNFNNGGRE
jgi:hypothetical protein